MAASDRAVAEARRWIGTPYRHQASMQGAGCDCLGLLRGVWRALYGAEPAVIPPYSADWAETGGDEALWQALAQHLPPAEGALAAGQILLFRMRAGRMAKHIGICSDTSQTPRFIHAYSGHGVVESPLSPPWARRIAARFEFK
ncbi:peptidase [Pararhodobacter oceanensis]|uniref:peptidase n=1 Tax=Pararhodobacter oceanensis TaxID=2172121 RepID=UPI003A90B0DC